MKRKFNPRGNLQRAERKISQFSDTKEWCGCLTPCEALALLNDGGQPTNSCLYTKEYLLEAKKSGQCYPRWFYFYPSKDQLKRWQ